MAELSKLLKTIGGAIVDFQVSIGLGTLGILAGVVIYLLLFQTSNIFLLSAKCWELLSNIWSKFEKRAVADRIRGTILEVSRNLNKEIKEISPYDLEIEWVEGMDRESFLRDNQVVVRMHHHNDKAKNLVIALADFVEKGVLPKAKKYMDGNVSKCTDLALIRKILIEKHGDSLDYFDDELLVPLLESDSELRELFEQIVCLDESGMLTQVVLREFLLLGKKLYPRVPDENIKTITKEFIHYLHEIATRDPGEDTNLNFNRGHIKVAVVIVAKTQMLDAHGIRPYPWRVKNYLDRGIETVYLIAPFRFGGYLKSIKQELSQDPRIKGFDEFTYYYMKDSRKIKSLCIAVYTDESRVGQAS